MTYNSLDKLASAIRNDVYGGLLGYHTNLSLNMEQLKDDIIDERLQIIKEYTLKGVLPYKDLLIEINCIDVDCKNIEKCRCKEIGTPTQHFEIPLLIHDFEDLAIEYIGTIDKSTKFLWYTSILDMKYHKYRKRGKKKPYVWIDTTPNENGMYDCFVFNAPLLRTVSIIGIFKDPRLLERYNCCMENADNNISFLDNEIKKRLTQKKLMYYRQYAPVASPNNLKYE